MAIVNINISAMKFDDITVTFHPRIPSRPVITMTENKQHEIGTTIQTNFLNTYHNVPIIKIKTPKPKITISFLI